MFSESSTFLLGQHGSCSAAQQPGELSKNILQNLSGQEAAPPGTTARLFFFHSLDRDQSSVLILEPSLVTCRQLNILPKTRASKLYKDPLDDFRFQFRRQSLDTDMDRGRVKQPLVSITFSTSGGGRSVWCQVLWLHVYFDVYCTQTTYVW